MRGGIPPLPQYAFMAWCLVKHRDNFTFTYRYFMLPLPSSYPCGRQFDCFRKYAGFVLFLFCFEKLELIKIASDSIRIGPSK
jgi:hypothetical protein